MGLQQINSSTMVGINAVDISHAQKTSAAGKVAELSRDAVGIAGDTNDVTKRSDVASNVGKYINNISTTSSVTSMLKSQVQAISNIQDKMSNVTSGVSTQESIQPEVAQFISKFNSSAGTINEKMDRLEDLDGDSTTYFDGSAGAIPLNIDMLNNSMATKRSELSSTLNKVQEVNEHFKQLAQSVISDEVQKTHQESPFKEINFGKESADFTAANMTNIVGSVASSQANALQAQSIRLLV
ncbi:MAG: hypothetical protein KAQ94_01930 [Arcobacteraceae bacterium]|nr:hypothetical protein [Arcobacteraceae bacterium]